MLIFLIKILYTKQALGVGDKQGGLEYCSPWVTKSRTQLSN